MARRAGSVPKETTAERDPRSRPRVRPTPSEPTHEPAAEPLTSTAPAPLPQAEGFVYSAKFVCGEQPTCGCECALVQPGRYATEINIHNFGIQEVAVHKRFIPWYWPERRPGASPTWPASARRTRSSSRR
jgi:hypothetical protein